MMNDSLILVNFNANVRVCLPRNSSRFNEASSFLVHIVATLCCRDVVADIGVQAFLPSAHGLIVELTTLLLQLVIANVECVSSETVVAHPHLILLSIQMVQHLIIILVVIIYTNATSIVKLLQVVSANTWFYYVQTVISLVVTITVRSIVLVCVYLILLRLPASTIIIEHRVLSCSRVVATTHFHLARILESQILLPLAIL